MTNNTLWGYARGRSSRRRYVVSAILLALLIVLVALARTPLGSLSIRGYMPLKGLSDAVRFSGSAVAGFFSSKEALVQENAKLQEEVTELQAKLADRDALYAENVQLKQSFGRDPSHSIILGTIIAAPPQTPYDELLIDAGSNLGVSPGDLVSAGGGALIGRIAFVYPASSRALLFSSAGQEWQGLLRGSIPVTVEGQGGGALKTEVPATTEASVGDPIIFPTLATGISEVVASVDTPPGNSFKTLYLHLPVNTSALRFVEIWRGTAQ